MQADHTSVDLRTQSLAASGDNDGDDGDDGEDIDNDDDDDEADRT